MLQTLTQFLLQTMEPMGMEALEEHLKEKYQKWEVL